MTRSSVSIRRFAPQPAWPAIAGWALAYRAAMEKAWRTFAERGANN